MIEFQILNINSTKVENKKVRIIGFTISLRLSLVLSIRKIAFPIIFINIFIE